MQGGGEKGKGERTRGRGKGKGKGGRRRQSLEPLSPSSSRARERASAFIPPLFIAAFSPLLLAASPLHLPAFASCFVFDKSKGGGGGRVREVVVVVVVKVLVVVEGAGPAGIATAGCLNKLRISNIVLERDDCPASLWRKRAYNRLKLHLGKDFCSLPHYPFPSDFPKFVPRVDFLRYIDSYITYFGIAINYNCSVDSAFIDQSSKKWRLLVTNNTSGADEIYEAEFLVVASGENSEEYIPNIQGLESYQGESMHCSKYLNGREMYKKNVLVFGCGNSGMEIAYDLSNWGAYTSIVVRSQVHYFIKEMVYAGMLMLKHFMVEKVDKMMVLMSKLKYENMFKYEKIKKGKVKVYPGISSIKEGKLVKFVDGQHAYFDAIIFATGYKTNVLKWLKDYKNLFNENGMPKPSYPNHWKGEHGIYSAGFSKRGLEGISFDAMKIANDINFILTSRVNQITS
ncbi:probable indole-3-pyruvate monooxygenase YUCCA11 [Arachis stenosperma]|uniref:probable indole-3-pyruvate monooxygenase YUCCA11 n=1 Tax=Arachis stenosperma TaxID=217475 RepID=UPI0025AD2FA4|nr:probable indole-3-pyruvate monooxygenase YUCCA11 [Arachis stenosperma]